MFNPYAGQPEEVLRPVPQSAGPERPPEKPKVMEGLLERLGRLDRDDLLLLVLVFLLAKDGEGDVLWPLAAAALYLML